jgi:hypothetical protein
MSMRNLAFHEIARNPYESAAPELWPAHAWIPALGIQGGVLFDVAGGLTGQVYSTSNPANSIPYLIGEKGLMVNCDSSYSVRNYSLPVIKFPFHIVMIGQVTSGTTQCMCSIGNLNSVSNAAFMAVTSGNIRQSIVTVSATDNYGGAVGTGVFSAIGAYNSETNRRLYLNGIFQTESVVSRGLEPLNPYNNIRIGSLPRSAETYFNGKVGYFGLYNNRSLSEQQLLRISSDPLLPFRRREITPYFFVPASGGTTVALSGAAAESVTEATPGTITVNQVIPVTLSGIASESTAEATPGSAVSGSTISQAIEGAASISSSDAVAGSATVNQVIPMALTGSASVSESTASAGTITVNQIIAQTLTGAASLSGGTATPGNVIAGEVVSQSLSGAVSESTAGATAGTITVEQVVSGALSGTLSVSESPAQVGTLTLGAILSGETAISDVFAVPGRENHEGFYEPQELTGAASASLSEASAGIAYWGKEIGPYSASRARVVSAKYQAILRSQKYNATRR